MKSITVLSSVEHQCATFIWPDDLRYYVGYRFLEGTPKTTRHPLDHGTTSPIRQPPAASQTMERSENWLDNWQNLYDDPSNPIKLGFQTFLDGSAETSFITNGGLQRWKVRFAPVENGVRLWMTLTTQEDILGAYVVQQCLRLGSDIGYGFRGSVAHTPFLSELLMQLLGNANGTMTWLRSDSGWQPFPVAFSRYHTAAGKDLFDDSSGQIDNALIVRESAPRDLAPASYWRYVAPDAIWKTWSAALYWERSATVSNRHPADCIHTGIDFGPLDAGESRTVQGRFYWLEGTKEDVLSVWEKEWG